MYREETYVGEWVLVYEQVLAQSMKSLTTGKDTPLEALFTMIDATSNNTSAEERLSMKKDAYMQLVTSVTASSQKTAMDLVDKKYVMHHSIKMAESDAEKAKQAMLQAKILNGGKMDEQGNVTSYDPKGSESYQTVRVKKAQYELTKRQVEAFEDTKAKDIMKVAIDGHAMLYEALEGNGVVVPSIYNSASDSDKSIDSLVEDARDRHEVVID